MAINTSILNWRQVSEGDDARFLAQSYIAHMMFVAIAICMCKYQLLNLKVWVNSD